MRRSDLLSQLVSQPGALHAPQAGGTVVAPMAAPPGNMRFGPASPGIVTNSGFSGAVSGHPVSMPHPDPPALAPAESMHAVPALAGSLAATGAMMPPSPGHFNGSGKQAPGGQPHKPGDYINPPPGIPGLEPGHPYIPPPPGTPGLGGGSPYIPTTGIPGGPPAGPPTAAVIAALANRGRTWGME